MLASPFKSRLDEKNVIFCVRAEAQAILYALYFSERSKNRSFSSMNPRPNVVKEKIASPTPFYASMNIDRIPPSTANSTR